MTPPDTEEIIAVPAWVTERGRLVPVTEYRSRRFAELDALIAAEAKRTAKRCHMSQCGRIHFAKGLCQQHYQARKRESTCSTEKCQRRVETCGLCAGCYQKARRERDQKRKEQRGC